MHVGEHKNIPVWQFETLDMWHAWLEEHYATEAKGIWIKIAKKGKSITTTRYEDVREGALCYGWIDSVANKFDETYYLLKVTPRRPKSVWSKINVALCEQYITEGKMKPSGLQEVTQAKADGRWAVAYGTGEKPKRI
jgi:uncharacterized protein YdeI (YjbR/CyaY-like superfamily)